VTRPVIGIAAPLVRAQWGYWDRPAALLAFNYIEAVQAADGMVVMIPPDPELERDPDQILDLIDGLILAGGNDIDPATYGAEPHPTTAPPVPERDAVELALTRRAWERDLPILGICRGMQLLNVARGGTLLQHLPDQFGHEEHRRVPGSFDGAEHDVRLRPGSLIVRAAGERVHVTKSHHHQGIDALGEGLEITGHSTLDDLPEAVEAPTHRFVLGVQWHPEADESSRVIASLVEAAREYRGEREAPALAYRSARGSA
jgi:putative glutamine amidotransferase